MYLITHACMHTHNITPMKLDYTLHSSLILTLLTYIPDILHSFIVCNNIHHIHKHKKYEYMK